MWQMLQLDEPSDYVIATGTSHSVRELVQLAFEAGGLNWEEHVVQDEALHPPSDIQQLIGDSSKAHSAFGWQPTTSFEGLVTMMVDADVSSAQ